MDKELKFVQKRIKVPQYQLDFTIYAKLEDAEQFNYLYNILSSAWLQLFKDGKISKRLNIWEIEKKPDEGRKERFEIKT